MDPLGSSPLTNGNSIGHGTMTSPAPASSSHLHTQTDVASSPLSQPSSTATTLPNLSPLGKRMPLGLPGERTSNYRPQPLPPPPSTSAWSSSPPTPHTAVHTTSPSSQWTPPPPAPRRAGSTTSGLTPRSPQGYSSPIRDRMDRDDRVGGAGVHPGATEAVARAPPPDAFVRIRITGLEKNRRDVYIKFNAESNMPSFRNSTYRSISRSYAELQKFAEAIAANNPQSIIPALPLVQTSAATEEEDDRLIKAVFQKWVARLTMDPAIMRDDELRSFIESEFGYTPSTRLRRKMPSTFHFPRGSRLPGEQDDELTLAKAAMVKLELQFGETAKAVEKVTKARRAAAQAYVEVADHLNTFSTTEPYAPLANGIKKLSRATKISADVMTGQAMSEMVTLGDALNYQASNARSAKETLMSRDVILDEHRTAAKATIAKRRNIERLKAGSSIKAERVDEALEELDEAKRHEALLSGRLVAISQNLQPSLRQHSVHAHQDILTALLDHSQAQLRYEKQWLKELELVRPELHGIKQPQPGVIYHASVSVPPVDSTPPRTSSSAAMVKSGSWHGGQASTPSSPSLGRGPPVGRGGPNFEDGGPLVPAPVPTAPAIDHRKRSIHSMAKSVAVADDRRQRVDAKMAASMLANGF